MMTNKIWIVFEIGSGDNYYIGVFNTDTEASEYVRSLKVYGDGMHRFYIMPTVIGVPEMGDDDFEEIGIEFY